MEFYYYSCFRVGIIPRVLLLLVSVGLLFTPDPVYAALIDKAMGAYASGRPAEARRMAQRVLANNPREARAFFLMAKTESGGRTAQSWAEQAIAAADGRSPGDEATVFLLAAYAATRSYGLIIERAERFFREFGDKNKFADAVRWWAVLAKIKLGRPADANADMQWAVSNPKSSTWSRRLRLLYADSRRGAEPAVRAYKKLLDVRDRYIESQALRGLVQAYEALGETDRALLYRGILDEKYPRVSLYSAEATSTETTTPTTPPDDEAEKLAEIAYTVQLGAFRDKANAQRLSDKYRKRKYTVHSFSRRVAGKRYWVVQVGSFTSLEKAKKLMEKLQREDQTAYRVVIR